MLMAPTGKAAKVLSDKTGRQAGTIHRAIYNYDDLKEFNDGGIDSSETFRLYAVIR
jgi:ATP-dependent exoDNAse (exonuclease V) alpha subunit